MGLKVGTTLVFIKVRGDEKVFIKVRGDENRTSFTYIYDENNYTVLYCTAKHGILNDFIRTVFKRPTSEITIVIRNGKIVWKHGPYLAEF